MLAGGGLSIQQRHQLGANGFANPQEAVCELFALSTQAKQALRILITALLKGKSAFGAIND